MDSKDVKARIRRIHRPRKTLWIKRRDQIMTVYLDCVANEDLSYEIETDIESNEELRKELMQAHVYISLYLKGELTQNELLAKMPQIVLDKEFLTIAPLRFKPFKNELSNYFLDGAITGFNRGMLITLFVTLPAYTLLYHIANNQTN